MAITKVTRTLLSTGIVDNSNATAITIDSSENVGIGTTSPVTALEVKGDGTSIQVSSADYDVALLGRRGSSGVDLDKGYMRLRDTGTTKAVIDSAGNSYFNGGSVGIGTASPATSTKGLHVVHDATEGTPSFPDGEVIIAQRNFNSSQGCHVGIIGGSAGESAINFGDKDDSDIGNITYNHAANRMEFVTNAAERMRIDSSGNLLVGKTSSGVSGVGAELRDGAANYSVTGTSSGHPVALFNRTSSDGEIAGFRKDNTAVGSINSYGGTYLFIGSSGNSSDTYLGFYNATVRPVNASGTNRDNVIDLGTSSARFDDVYATNGTIQTSDRNEKQDIAELTDAETRVAVAAKGLLRKFRWIDSVEEKGDEARTHFGIIAQDLQDAFTAEGLDAGDYAMFISGTWTDDDGVEQTRLGVRYSELLAFIIAAI